MAASGTNQADARLDRPSPAPAAPAAQGAGGLREQIERLGPWFHNLKLPDGSGGVVHTHPDHPFGDFPQFKWDEIQAALPSDLSGRTCLDIGTNSGFYAFKLAERGARVLGIDLNDHYLRQARFARDLLGLGDQVELRNQQIYALASLEQQFDVILFMGVFYHLRYPLLGLDAVVTRLKPDGLMLFQTLTMPGQETLPPDRLKNLDFYGRDRLNEPGWPKMAFFEHGFNDDPTNWWAPSHAACESLLRSSGLKILEHPGHEMYLCTPDPDAYTGVRHLREQEFRAALTGLCPG